MAGEGAAEVSQRQKRREQSPSPRGGDGHQHSEHESRPKKKLTGGSADYSTEFPKLPSTPPLPGAKQGKCGFDVAGLSGAGPSWAGGQITLQAGQKRAAGQTFQSPQKTPSKLLRQQNVQYRLSQQDLQPAPARVYLPSAPMGALREMEMTKRSTAMGAAE